ncbi:DUF1405 domain-containing protein [Candidatus Micrarchaeota archaeon]|nr:DUF1405 domain-containing protein [Candidatus Micrarchaeota archaeon]
MKRSLLVISLIILVDLAGLFYGYYYYSEQLYSSPIYLWLFIPDCPFYVMLFTIALVLAVFGFENKLFSYIAVVGMMKYGMWTLAALLVFGDYFFSVPFFLMSLTLFMLHIGMTLEGPLLIPKKLSKLHLGICLLWFLIHDYFDYFYGYLDRVGRYALGTHPILPSADRIPAMMALTFMLSVILSFLIYKWSLVTIRWPVRKELAEVQKHFQKTKESRGRRSRSSR